MRSGVRGMSNGWEEETLKTQQPGDRTVKGEEFVDWGGRAALERNPRRWIGGLRSYLMVAKGPTCH